MHGHACCSCTCLLIAAVCSSRDSSLHNITMSPWSVWPQKAQLVVNNFRDSVISVWRYDLHNLLVCSVLQYRTAHSRTLGAPVGVGTAAINLKANFHINCGCLSEITTGLMPRFFVTTTDCLWDMQAHKHSVALSTPPLPVERKVRMPGGCTGAVK